MNIERRMLNVEERFPLLFKRRVRVDLKSPSVPLFQRGKIKGVASLRHVKFAVECSMLDVKWG